MARLQGQPPWASKQPDRVGGGSSRGSCIPGPWPSPDPRLGAPWMLAETGGAAEDVRSRAGSGCEGPCAWVPEVWREAGPCAAPQTAPGPQGGGSVHCQRGLGAPPNPPAPSGQAGHGLIANIKAAPASPSNCTLPPAPRRPPCPELSAGTSPPPACLFPQPPAPPVRPPPVRFSQRALTMSTPQPPAPPPCAKRPALSEGALPTPSHHSLYPRGSLHWALGPQRPTHPPGPASRAAARRAPHCLPLTAPQGHLCYSPQRGRGLRSTGPRLPHGGTPPSHGFCWVCPWSPGPTCARPSRQHLSSHG